LVLISLALNLAKSPEYLKTAMKLSLVKVFLFADFLIGPMSSIAFLIKSASEIFVISISSNTEEEFVNALDWPMVLSINLTASLSFFKSIYIAFPVP